MTEVRHHEIGPEEAGQRFDRWVRNRYPELSHGQLQKLLRTGQFRLDGRRIRAGTRLEAGQVVRIPPLPGRASSRPPGRPPVSPEDGRFIRRLVLHRDDHILVIDKPAGLAVQGGTGTRRHVDGMLDALAEGGERPRLVHRLDRDTAGLLVLARTAAAARLLMHAFQQHRVRKLYWAVVAGRPERAEGLIALPLGKAGPPGAERMVANAPAARRARTAYRQIAAAGRVGAWLGLMPLTGRTHQLRAHCAALGCPILGDRKYGGGEATPASAPPGLMLQAMELEFPHPASGRRFRIATAPARHLREALAWLGMNPAERMPFARLEDWPPDF